MTELKQNMLFMPGFVFSKAKFLLNWQYL